MYIRRSDAELPCLALFRCLGVGSKSTLQALLALAQSAQTSFRMRRFKVGRAAASSSIETREDGFGLNIIRPLDVSHEQICRLVNKYEQAKSVAEQVADEKRLSQLERDRVMFSEDFNHQTWLVTIYDMRVSVRECMGEGGGERHLY